MKWYQRRTHGRSVLSPTRLSVESMSPIPFFVILLVIGSINGKPNPMGESEKEPEPEPEPEAGKKCTDCESRFKYTKAGDDDGPVIYELPDDIDPDLVIEEGDCDGPNPKPKCPSELLNPTETKTGE